MLPTFSSELCVCRDAALLDGAKKFGATALVAEPKCMKRAKPMAGKAAGNAEFKRSARRME
jgi:hypothetical protein